MKTEKWMKAALLMAVSAVAFVGCNNSKYPGFKTMDNGVNIKYHTKGEGNKKPVVNSMVTLNMNYGLADTVLFESGSLPEPLVFPVIEPTFQGDLYSALTLLNVGDSVTIAFPADSFFMVMAQMPKSPEFVKPGDVMYFDLKLVDVKTEEETKAEQHAMMLQMKAQEQEVLTKYLADKNITTAPLPSGLYYTETKKGSGPLPKVGDVLKVHFSVSMIEGFPLFSNFDKEPMDIEFGQQFDTKGFDEALGYLRKGTRASLIVPSNIAFDSTGRSQMIPPYSTILYDVELVAIRDKADVERENEANKKKAAAESEKAQVMEMKKISDYLKTNNVTVSPTASGLYYIETVKGTGKSAENGKNIKAHYTLYNLEGKKLQSSLDGGQPFTFVLGQGQVIKGWDEGFLMMKEGGKARFIVPSSLAYGGTARGEDIPAFSPLVFDVEFIEVVE